MSTGKVLMGILAGAAAGAILGILFAPDKGCETRHKIAKGSHDLLNDLNQTLREFMAEVSEKIDSVVKEVKEPTEKAN